MGRRDQIVEAARALLEEGEPRALSVRVVAARSGVGASTLRHYFPTQLDLRSAVLATYIDDAIGDARILDEAITPRDRLIECLLQFLPPTLDATTWRLAIGGLFGEESAVKGGDRTWALLAERYHGRVAAWLGILVAEGAVEGDVDRHARFLVAVVDGLAIGRLAEASATRDSDERQVIEDAVDAVVR